MPSVLSVLVLQIFITSLCGLLPVATEHTQKPRTRRQTSTIACAPTCPSQDAKWVQRINHLGKATEEEIPRGIPCRDCGGGSSQSGPRNRAFSSGKFQRPRIRG